METLFADTAVVNPTPVLQVDFAHGLNTNVGTATTANSATVDANTGRLRLQSGTNSAGSGIYSTVKGVRSRAGNSVEARFTAAFTTGVASSTQIVGLGNASDGYFFGFNGTSFGILYRNSITGSVVNTWTAQTAWNGNRVLDQRTNKFGLTKTYFNEFKIEVAVNFVKFWVQDDNARWVLVHTIRGNNSTASLQLQNPNIGFYAQSINAGSTTNMILYVGHVGVFVNGSVQHLGPIYASSNRKATVTTQTNILTIKNATTYNGVTNRSLIRIRHISVALESATDTGLLQVIKSTTLGGSPSYSAVSGTTADGGVTITSGQSLASVDTAGTTITGGTIVYAVAASRFSSGVVDVTDLGITVEPGTILTFAVTGDASATARVSVNWSEDI